MNVTDGSLNNCTHTGRNNDDVKDRSIPLIMIMIMMITILIIVMMMMMMIVYLTDKCPSNKDDRVGAWSKNHVVVLETILLVFSLENRHH